MNSTAKVGNFGLVKRCEADVLLFSITKPATRAAPLLSGTGKALITPGRAVAVAHTSKVLDLTCTKLYLKA